MSNSEVSIDWANEATTPLSSWADEMDELDAIESPTPSIAGSTDDSQPIESPLISSSSSSSDNEEDRRSFTRELRSTDPNSIHDSRERLSSSGNSLNRSGTYQRSSNSRRNSLSDGSPSKPSVKEQIPFPSSAPFVAFITNLHADATRELVSSHLEPVTGLPKNVKIILDKETSRPRGFCYVEFEDADGLRAAIDADGLEFMSQPLHIVVAEQKKEKIRNSYSSSRDRRDSSSDLSTGKHYQPRHDHHDSKGRVPRVDSASQLSKGKFDNSFKPRKDDVRFQTPRANSFAFDKRSFSKPSPSKMTETAGGFQRERSPQKDSFVATTKFDGIRKADEKSMSVGNMFAALRMDDDM